VHIVGFIIEIYQDAWPYKRQIYNTLLITVPNYSAVFATHIMTYLTARNLDNFKKRTYNLFRSSKPLFIATDGFM